MVGKVLQQSTATSTLTNSTSGTPKASKGNFLSRPVSWLRGEASTGMDKTWRLIAAWSAAFFLAATLVGIPIVLYGIKEWRRQDKELESLIKSVTFEEAVKKGNARAIRGHLNTMGSSKERREAIEKPDSSDFTPLYYAAQSGSAEAINILLKTLGSYEARRKAIFKYNKWSASTPLHSAACQGVYNDQGSVEAIHALLNGLKSPEDKEKALEQRDDLGRTALHYAVGDEKRIAALLSGYSTSAKKKAAVTNGTYNKTTPLHHAAQGKNTAPLNTLLNVLETPKEKKEAARKANNEGITPLHWAAEKGSKEVFLSLLNLFETPEEKIEVLKMQTNWGQTVLHHAAKSGNAEVLKEIVIYLKEDQDILKKDKYLSTPLHHAVSSENYEAVRTLLKACGDFPVMSPLEEYEETLLHRAARNKTVGILQLLLNSLPKDPKMRIAALHSTNKKYKFPSEIAKEYNNRAAVKILEKALEEAKKELAEMSHH